ncbi:MAG: hypothetical protein VX951_14145 [Planctomycetota bacterium]|nr:hypothetical protein [Planctomycetota bacterium]
MWNLILLFGLLCAVPTNSVGTSSGGPVTTRHPVDGPDVDVRVQIQDQAVKFQIIMNLAYIDEIADTPREDEYSIQPHEHQGIRKALFEFYRQSNRVRIDSVEVAPVDKAFVVDEGDMDMLPLFPRCMEKALVRVQMSIEYPCKSPPSSVSFAWGEFPVNPILVVADSKPKIEIQAHLIAKGIDKIVPLTEQEPEFTWHDTGESVEDRFLSVPKPPSQKSLQLPLVSAAISAVVLLAFLHMLLGALSRSGRQLLGRRGLRVGLMAVLLAPVGYVARDRAIVSVPDPFDQTPALPTIQQARAIFTPLHRNIYRAFDYVEEGDIYDALARSVEGELLDNLYNQVYRSLIMHEEGGAVSRVNAVRTVNAEVESVGLLEDRGDRPGFQVHAKWQVDGVVRHWNHAHYRTNEYEARYTVVQAEDGWRIADNVIMGQKRIDEGGEPPGK